MKWYEKLMKWLMPNGVGTKATLALIVVVWAMPGLTGEQKFRLAELILIFYFAKKMQNGGGAGATDRSPDS